MIYSSWDVDTTGVGFNLATVKNDFQVARHIRIVQTKRVKSCRDHINLHAENSDPTFFSGWSGGPSLPITPASAGAQ
jgi:hypothetical protein